MRLSCYGPRRHIQPAVTLLLFHHLIEHVGSGAAGHIFVDDDDPDPPQSTAVLDTVIERVLAGGAEWIAILTGEGAPPLEGLVAALERDVQAWMRERSAGSERSRFGRNRNPARCAPTIGSAQNATTPSVVPPARTAISVRRVPPASAMAARSSA